MSTNKKNKVSTKGKRKPANRKTNGSLSEKTSERKTPEWKTPIHPEQLKDAEEVVNIIRDATVARTETPLGLPWLRRLTSNLRMSISAMMNELPYMLLSEEAAVRARFERLLKMHNTRLPESSVSKEDEVNYLKSLSSNSHKVVYIAKLAKMEFGSRNLKDPLDRECARKYVNKYFGAAGVPIDLRVEMINHVIDYAFTKFDDDKESDVYGKSRHVTNTPLLNWLGLCTLMVLILVAAYLILKFAPLSSLGTSLLSIGLALLRYGSYTIYLVMVILINFVSTIIT